MKNTLLGFALIGLLNCTTLFAQNPPMMSLKAVDGFFKTPPDGNMVQPTGVAVNSEGHIFVFNKGNKQLMEFDTRGNYVRTLGKGMFIEPHGLRIDKDDNIWTTDLSTHLVIKMDPEGRLLMVLGQKETDGLYDDVRKEILFFKPADVAFGANGDIYVADGYGNARVVHLDKNGKRIRTWGKQGPEPGNFDNPHNIITDQMGNVYIADRNNSRIQVFDKDGNPTQVWEHVGKPWGLAISDDHIYMTDGDAEAIYKLGFKGEIFAKAQLGPGAGPGKMRAGHGIAVGKDGALYVTEVLNWRVQKFLVE